MLHFGTQTWITTTSDKKNRGRNIAYYGLFFGLGFALGPLMTTFLAVNEALPFLLSAVFSMVVWASMFFVRDRKSTRLNSSHVAISYAVFCLKKKNRSNVEE